MAILSSQLVNLIEARLGINATTIRHADLSADMVTDVERLKDLPMTHSSWERIINALTIGETYFMRDIRQFDLLRQTVLPALIKQRRETQDLRLTLWSAACATGEEAYSLAILLRELLPDYDAWDIRIIGSDINQQALNQARKAIYRNWSFRETSTEFKTTYFTKQGDSYALNTPYRLDVTWQTHNLLNPPPVFNADVILCRNVLMYFSDEQAQCAEQLLTDALTNNGWLLLGAAEQLESSETFIMPPRDVPMYQKKPASISPQKPIMTVDETPEDLYRQAVKAVHHEATEKALTLLQSLLQAQPNHENAHILIAFVLANRGKYDDAQQHVQRALNINPLCQDAHYIQALIHYEQESYAAADKALNAALYSNREHLLALFLQANLYEQRGEMDEANRVWINLEKAIFGLGDDTFVSDLSDMRVGAMRVLLETRVAE